MEDFNAGKNHLSGIFPNNGSIKTDLKTEPNQYYAVSSKNEADRQFDVILRSGDEYSFHYSRLLPFYRLKGNNVVTICSYNLFISIKGRNLRTLRDALKKEKVIWMKESPSGKDDGSAEVFISEIQVYGDALNDL